MKMIALGQVNGRLVLPGIFITLRFLRRSRRTGSQFAIEKIAGASTQLMLAERSFVSGFGEITPFSRSEL